MHFGLRGPLIFALHLAVCLPAWADPETDAPAADESAQGTGADLQPEGRRQLAVELVSQLADEDFKIRETATRRLTQLGLDARSALEAGLKHDDLEVRTRSARIWSRVQELDFQQRIERFLKETDNSQDHGLPGWKRFSEHVGVDPSSRELFVEIQRSEGRLLQAVRDKPELAPQMLADRMDNARESQKNVTGGQQQSLSVGTVAAMLFIGSDPRIKVSDQTNQYLFYFVNQPDVQRALTNEEESIALRELIGNFLERNDSPVTAYQSAVLAMRYNLKRGLKPALAVLGNKQVAATQRAYCALAVAKLGDGTHRLALEGLLEEQSACGSIRVANQQINTQLRDVALAALVLLNKESLKEYGFKHARENSWMLYSPHTLGFTTDDERKAAFAKWRERTTGKQAD